MPYLPLSLSLKYQLHVSCFIHQKIDVDEHRTHKKETPRNNKLPQNQHHQNPRIVALLQSSRNISQIVPFEDDTTNQLNQPRRGPFQELTDLCAPHHLKQPFEPRYVTEESSSTVPGNQYHLYYQSTKEAAHPKRNSDQLQDQDARQSRQILGNFSENYLADLSHPQRGIKHLRIDRQIETQQRECGHAEREAQLEKDNFSFQQPVAHQHSQQVILINVVLY